MSQARTLDQWLEQPPAQDGLLQEEARREVAHLARELGLPAVRNEAWRYTRLGDLEQELLHLDPDAPLPDETQLRALTPEGIALDRMVVVNGRLLPGLCRIGPLPDGVGLGSLRTMRRAAREGDKGASLLLEHLDQLSQPRQRVFSAINSALAEDACALWVPQGVRLPRPVLVISLVLPQVGPLLSQPRLLAVLSPESQATVLEAHGAFGDTPYLCNAISEFHVEAGARLEHVRVQRDSPAGRRISGAFLRLKTDARARSHTFTLGGRTVRNEVHLELVEPGASGEINGLGLLKGDSHLDNHTHVTHLAPDCHSRQGFRTILAERSRGIFTGRIQVTRQAQRTDAVQQCASMVLSSDARAVARPQLEIHADDVKCTHGSTVGSLDANSLFYLRSRGIPGDLARRILIHAFCSAQLGRVRTGELVNPLDRLITRTLADHT